MDISTQDHEANSSRRAPWIKRKAFKSPSDISVFDGMRIEAGVALQQGPQWQCPQVIHPYGMRRSESVALMWPLRPRDFRGIPGVFRVPATRWKFSTVGPSVDP